MYWIWQNVFGFNEPNKTSLQPQKAVSEDTDVSDNINQEEAQDFLLD